MPSCVVQLARALGPEAGDARDLDQAGRDALACSFSAAGIEPVSSSASIFSAIVLPTPASSVTRPWRASSATDTPDSRIALAALR